MEILSSKLSSFCLKNKEQLHCTWFLSMSVFQPFLLKYLRAAASVQHDPVFNTVSKSKFCFPYQSRIAWVTTVLFAHNPKGGCFDSTSSLTWVGILLTVWLLLTVCHEYGGVVGYDMLALGLSYKK